MPSSSAASLAIARLDVTTFAKCRGLGFMKLAVIRADLIAPARRYSAGVRGGYQTTSASARAIVLPRGPGAMETSSSVSVVMPVWRDAEVEGDFLLDHAAAIADGAGLAGQQPGRCVPAEERDRRAHGHRQHEEPAQVHQAVAADHLGTSRR